MQRYKASIKLGLYIKHVTFVLEKIYNELHVSPYTTGKLAMNYGVIDHVYAPYVSTVSLHSGSP